MTYSIDITSLKKAYAAGTLTPVALVEEILRRTAHDPHCVWITRLSDTEILAYAAALADKDPATLPLYGIPFAIKDNIDLAHIATTAGCKEYAYTPTSHAFVVRRLIDAGAIPIGKTNLDQFATGLNGTRSPWGACRNALNKEYISGGSSSGSAVAVALGYVSFALGTDTAGSGRVPAAFNNIIGHKPSLGWLSAHGLVPACRSLDTISIFALTAADAETVTAITAAYDATDPFSRAPRGHGFDFGQAAKFRVGIPKASQLQFFANDEATCLFDAAVERIKGLGGECIEFDLQPFLDTAKLLYGGPWVAERYAAIESFLNTYPQAPLPVIQEIIGQAKQWSAAHAYQYSYRLKAYKRQCDTLLGEVDCVMLPTAGTIYTISELEADPIKLNSNLGYYTNFMNLLDYAATALPAGFQSNGLPFGITLFTQREQDGPLLRLAGRMHQALGGTLGATAHLIADNTPQVSLASGQVRVAVVGAHLSGLPLNPQLTSRHARLISTCKTAAKYRLYALPDGKRPALIQVAEQGASIECEVWELAASEFGSFVAGIPAPLGIGKIELSDGSIVNGFICEPIGISNARDITEFGGWRNWLAALLHNPA